jgi:serine/threonine-protein kinase CHEK2
MLPLLLLAHFSNSAKAASIDDEGSDLTKKQRRDAKRPDAVHTPLKAGAPLPSPMTRTESTTDFKNVSTNEAVQGSAATPDSSVTPSYSHMSPTYHDNSSSSQAAAGSQTQPFSQVIFPPPPIAYEVEDEEAEGVWGYLIPVDGKSSSYGTLVMKDRETCMTAQGDRVKESSVVDPDKYKNQENDLEKKKETKSPSRGYLIGRHPECGEFHMPIITIHGLIYV